MKSHFVSKICLVLILMSSSIYSFIPFNPIINPANGDPLTWNGNTLSGRIGWLDVPQHGKISFDRVFALQDGNGWIHYIHPANFDYVLPKGLFCWQSDWKGYAKQYLGNQYQGLYDDYLYFTKNIQNRTIKDIAVRNQPDQDFVRFDGTNWIIQTGKHKGGSWDATKQKFQHPSDVVDQFFQWAQEDMQNNRLFRPLAFHMLMGVTEQYMREFFGSDAQQLFLARKNRTNVSMPSIKQMETSFPLNHKDFRFRQYINPQGHILLPRSLAQLRNTAEQAVKFKGALGVPTLVIHDGYEIFERTGDQEQARKETDVRYLLAHPYFNDAVIMSASTPDGLEGGISDPVALVSEMQWAPTQGEEIALAAGLAIWLKYYDQRYHMFEDVKKIQLQGNKIVNIFSALDDNDIPTIKAILHKNVMVTSGYYPSYFLDQQLNKDEQQRVNYVHTNMIIDPKRNPINLFNSLLRVQQATNEIGVLGDQHVNVILNSALNLRGHTNDKVYTESAKIILKAMYLNTLYSAITLRKQKVILTLLGAGSFENKLSWIGDILQSDEVADIITQGGLEVHVLIYPDFRAGRKFQFPDYPDFKTSLDMLKQKIQSGSSKQQIFKKEEREDEAEQKIRELVTTRAIQQRAQEKQQQKSGQGSSSQPQQQQQKRGEGSSSQQPPQEMNWMDQVTAWFNG